MFLCNLCDNEALITIFPVPKGKNTPKEKVVNIPDLKPNICTECYFKVCARIKMPEYKNGQTVEEWDEKFRILNNL
mgnify:CR=1 FL=1